jgi:hypothetical protein
MLPQTIFEQTKYADVLASVIVFPKSFQHFSWHHRV